MEVASELTWSSAFEYFMSLYGAGLNTTANVIFLPRIENNDTLAPNTYTQASFPKKLRFSAQSPPGASTMTLLL